VNDNEDDEETAFDSGRRQAREWLAAWARNTAHAYPDPDNDFQVGWNTELAAYDLWVRREATRGYIMDPFNPLPLQVFQDMMAIEFPGLS
jgi:hypothetical protein